MSGKAKPELAQVGDIITSPSFVEAEYAYGWHDGMLRLDRDRPLTIGPSPGGGVINWYEKETIEGGFSRTVPRQLHVRADDPTRGTSRFIVERAQLQGGGCSHGPYDVYPDGWHVVARRMDGDERQRQERIAFYQTGCFTGLVTDLAFVERASGERMIRATKVATVLWKLREYARSPLPDTDDAMAEMVREIERAAAKLGFGLD